MIDARLAEMGFQSVFLDLDPVRGIPVGADWERTLYERIDRCDAVVIVLSPNWVASKWCFVEFAQARALGKTIFPVLIDKAAKNAIPKDIQRLDLTTQDDAAYDELQDQLKKLALDARGGLPWDGTRPPYPGMLAFEESDAAVFFGRDQETRKLIERLNALRIRGSERLIAVLGSSGSGKSSLLRAGVLPRLRLDQDHWIAIAPLRPGQRPLQSLLNTLSVHLNDPDLPFKSDMVANGQADALALNILQALHRKHQAPDAQFLIPIDQGEELFSVSRLDEAQAFATLVAALSQATGRCTVLITMRSEFLGSLQRDPVLGDRIEEFSLGPMPLSRIRDIVTGPANVANLTVDDALVDKIREDAETEDALPLIAFTLREMFDGLDDDHRLRLADYLALGSGETGQSALENVVRVAAEELIEREQPTEPELAALRESFIPHLINLTESGELTRRSAEWAVLAQKAHRMLQHFVDARLLVSSADADGTRHSEISHEALLRTWPRLQNWAENDRQFLIWSRDTSRAARNWRTANPRQRSTALLQGWEIDLAIGMMAEHGNRIASHIQRFVKNSFFRRYYGRLALVVGGVLVLSPTVADTLEVLISIAAGQLDWSRLFGLSAIVARIDILGAIQLGLQGALAVLLVALLVKRRRVTRGSDKETATIDGEASQKR